MLDATPTSRPGGTNRRHEVLTGHETHAGPTRAGNEARPAHSGTRLTTGTTTVALTAADGAVLASDRRASAGGGRVAASKGFGKVEAVHPTAAVALAGAVGSLQAFARALRAEVRLYETRRGEPPGIEALATLAGGLLRGGAFPGSSPLVAGVDGGGPRAFDLDGGGGVLSADYVAGGSGMQVALGVLEDRYEAGLDLDAAAGLAAAAVGAASERDNASGDGLCLGRVTADGVAVAEHDDPAEVAR